MRAAFAVGLLLGISFASRISLAQAGGQVGGAYTAAPPPAREEHIDNIGEQGQLVFGVDRVMGIASDHIKVEQGSLSATTNITTFSVFGTTGAVSMIPRLALDYFVTDGISIGGSFVYVHGSASSDVAGAGFTSSGDSGSQDLVLVHPRVGYAYAFDDTFAIWPRVGATYYYLKSSGGTDVSWNAFEATGEVLLAISPFEHFAILIGPYIEFPLSGKAKSGGTESDEKLTAYGMTTSIVGYY